MINYYQRPEVSNSDLSWLQKQLAPQSVVLDLENAYRFGNLLDLLITEPELVDFFKMTMMTAQGETKFTKEELERAQAMKKVFFSDPFCKQIAAQSEKQKISVEQEFKITYDGLEFELPVRCKYDFFAKGFDLVVDLKSTACTSQKQFEESIEHFQYNRQAAWYLDIPQRNNFMFIGISKENFKIFKVPLKRGSDLFNQGQAKYQELAFHYWSLFGNIKQVA